MLAVIAAHVTEVLWIAPDRARVAVVGELLEAATAWQRLPQVLVGVDVLLVHHLVRDRDQ
jgi:hypothetical protein